MLPHGSGETKQSELSRSRVVISIFYSNPEKLEVLYKGRLVPRLEAHMTAANSYNFSMRKPTVNDTCGANAFAGWENKLYVLVCGGLGGVEIKTVKKIVLSIGIELETEDFFDQHYLVRNLASLFGIPSARMRVPKIVAGSDRRRRRLAGAASTAVDIEILAEDLCDKVETCGPHGVCFEGQCTCEEGWKNADGCAEGDCLCSKPELASACPDGCDECDAESGQCLTCADATPVLFGGACGTGCPANHAVVLVRDNATDEILRVTCAQCHVTCGGSCVGPAADQCTSCDSVGTNAYLLRTRDAVSAVAGVASHRDTVAQTTGRGEAEERARGVAAAAERAAARAGAAGRCLLRCPTRMYADEARVCRGCASNCKSCDGPRATQCTSCEPNACAKRGGCPEGKVFPSLDTLGRCVSNCPAGQYANKAGRCASCPLTRFHAVQSSLHIPCLRLVPAAGARHATRHASAAQARCIRSASTLRPRHRSFTQTARQVRAAAVARRRACWTVRWGATGCQAAHTVHHAKLTTVGHASVMTPPSASRAARAGSAHSSTITACATPTARRSTSPTGQAARAWPAPPRASHVMARRRRRA